MANRKKGFVLYFDSLGLLSLFPPAQIGELLLALYDYADRICETEESPEAALLRYPTLDGATQVGFCSIAGHILRDTRKWKQRQQNCQQSALERHRKARDEAALQQAAPQPKTDTKYPQSPPPREREPYGSPQQERQPYTPARSSRYSRQQQGIPEDEMARHARTFQDSYKSRQQEQTGGPDEADPASAPFTFDFM